MAMTIEELRGLLQPSAAETNQAQAQGLLSLGAGILANNRGNYGAFGPAMGAGLQQGLQGFNAAKKSGEDARLQNMGMQIKVDDIEKAQQLAKAQQEWRSSMPQARQVPIQSQPSVGMADPTQPIQMMGSEVPQVPQMRTVEPTHQDINNWLVKGASIDPLMAEHAAGIIKATRPEKATPSWHVIETAQGQQLIDANDPTHSINFGSKPRQAAGGGMGGDTASSFSDGAIDLAAYRYNADGTLPPMGMGKAGAAGRARILNRAAEISGQGGVAPEDARGNQMDFKANAGALNQINKQKTMVSAFEKNFSLNADMALKLSDKVDRTGVPLFNAWIQAGQKNIQGNPALSQFHAANETVVNEYAKIMSGSMGNTAVSDSARAHAHSLLSTVQTKDQYLAVMNTLRQETGNRMLGFDQEIDAVKSRMKPQTNKPTETPPAKVVKFDANGNMVQ
jgi:hypothetical protein